MQRMTMEPGTEHPPHEHRTPTLPRKPSLTLAMASLLELCPGTPVGQTQRFQQPLASLEGDWRGFQGSWGQALGDSRRTPPGIQGLAAGRPPRQHRQPEAKPAPLVSSELKPVLLLVLPTLPWGRIREDSDESKATRQTGRQAENGGHRGCRCGT